MISAWKYLEEIPQRMKVFFEMPSAFVASEQSRCESVWSELGQVIKRLPILCYNF